MQELDENGPMSNINSELELRLKAAQADKNFAKMPALRRLRGVVFAFLGLGLICQPMSILFGWYVRMSYRAVVASELGLSSYLSFALYAIGMGAQLTLSWILLWMYCRFLKQFHLNQLQQLQQTSAALLPASRYQILFGVLVGFVFPAAMFQNKDATLALAQSSFISLTAFTAMYYLFRHYVVTAQGEISELTSITLQDACRGFYRTWSPKFALLMPVALIVIGIGFSFSPTTSWLKYPIPVTVLPSCTDTEVITLLDKAMRSSPIGTRLIFIDSHRQLKFDRSEDVRYGECIAHIKVDDSRASMDAQIKFVVEWMDREKRLFQVRVLPNEPPLCTDPSVVKLLEQSIRSAPMGANLKSIDGQRELRYDRDASIRFGEFMAHYADRDIPVKFVIVLNRELDVYETRILPTELPQCDEPEVIAILNRVVQGIHTKVLKSTEGHRQLSYDREADVRYGEFTVSFEDEDIKRKFVVEWQNRDLGAYQVRIVPELPTCTDQDIENQIKKLVADLAVGTNLKSIEGHRELQYDQEKEIRYGECIANTETEPVKLGFTISWQDRIKGLYQVQIQSHPN